MTYYYMRVRWNDGKAIWAFFTKRGAFRHLSVDLDERSRPVSAESKRVARMSFRHHREVCGAGLIEQWVA